MTNDNAKVVVTYLSLEINDMTTVVVYGRNKALEYAKGKQYVSIQVSE